MRIDLQSLDSQAIAIELPPTGQDGHREQIAKIRRFEGLHGALIQQPDSLTVKDATVARAALDALVLWFGTVEVAADEGASLRDVNVRFERDAAGVDLALDAVALETSSLRIGLPTLEVNAAANLLPVRLRVKGSDGSVHAPRANLSHFRLTLANVEILAERLTADELLVEWKPGLFSLKAERVSASGLTVVAAGTTVRAGSAEAATFGIHNGDISVRGFEITETLVEVEIPKPDAAVAAGNVPPEVAGTSSSAVAPGRSTGDEPPLLDFLLFDKLSGTVAADANVDTTVPVIGHRRGKHTIRLHLQDGTLDFRELESGLARLEDSLLDFSVRDDELVLELGLPVLPTRGRGKPLVRWSLTDEEQQLAAHNRVRIAKLLQPQGTGQSDGGGRPSSIPPPSSEGQRKVELRELSLENVRLDLALPGPDEPLPARLRTLKWNALRAKGALHHTTGSGSAEGKVEAEIEGLELDLRDLPLSDRALTIDSLRVTQLSHCEAQFDGLRPKRLSFSIDKASSAGIDFSERE